MAKDKSTGEDESAATVVGCLVLTAGVAVLWTPWAALLPAAMVGVALKNYSEAHEAAKVETLFHDVLPNHAIVLTSVGPDKDSQSGWSFVTTGLDPNGRLCATRVAEQEPAATRQHKEVVALLDEME